MDVIAQEAFRTLPEEILEFCDSLTIRVEDFPDEAVQQELELDDGYDLLALYRSGKQLSPGIEKKGGKDEDVMIVYRRPILDLWCETEDDITQVVREAMIEELGTRFDFSEDEITEMTRRYYQGLL